MARLSVPVINSPAGAGGSPALKLFDAGAVLPGNQPPGLDPRMTLEAFFEQIYLRQRLLGCSAKTVTQYRVLLRHLARFAGRSPLCCELSDELLGDFMAWRISDCQVAAPTVNKDFRQLKSLWAHCRRKRRQFAPRLKIGECTVEALPEPKRIRRCWTTEQLTQLLAACRQERELFFCVRADRWWTALVLVIYDTSVRISAIMSVRRADIDLAAGTLLVRAEEQKHKADQLVELSAQTLSAIRDVWLPERALLFEYPYDRTQDGWPSLTARLKKILKRAGLPATRLDLFHRIRRTTASYTRKTQGLAAAQEHLGHSTPAVTAGYLDPDIVGQRTSAKHLPRPQLPSEQRRLFD